MEIVETKDIATINAIFRDPEIFKACKDDSCAVDPTSYDLVPLIGSWLFLEVKRYLNSPAIGMFIVKPGTDTSCEIHTLMTKECRGAMAIEAGKLVLDWIFKNTNYTRVNSYVFSDAPSVLWYVKRMGFRKVEEKPWIATREGKPVNIMEYEFLKN